MVGILGLNPQDPQWRADAAGEASTLDSLVGAMIDQRAEARATKDWVAADRIRAALGAAGITLEDGADGTHWSIDG